MIRSVPAQVVLNGVLVGVVAVVIAGSPATAATQELAGPWAPLLRRADDALARKEFSAALKAANEAYAAALGAQRWDGMVAAGDAYRRLGEATGLGQSFHAKAREAYAKALFRARQLAAVDGVLRVAEGFAALRDAEMVTQCLRIAERLAARSPGAQADVRAFAARLSDRSAATATLPH